MAKIVYFIFSLFSFVVFLSVLNACKSQKYKDDKFLTFCLQNEQKIQNYVSDNSEISILLGLYNCRDLNSKDVDCELEVIDNIVNVANLSVRSEVAERIFNRCIELQSHKCVLKLIELVKNVEIKKRLIKLFLLEVSTEYGRYNGSEHLISDEFFQAIYDYQFSIKEYSCHEISYRYYFAKYFQEKENCEKVMQIVNSIGASYFDDPLFTRRFNVKKLSCINKKIKSDNIDNAADTSPWSKLSSMDIEIFLIIGTLPSKPTTSNMKLDKVKKVLEANPKSEYWYNWYYDYKKWLKKEKSHSELNNVPCISDLYARTDDIRLYDGMCSKEFCSIYHHVNGGKYEQALNKTFLLPNFRDRAYLLEMFSYGCRAMQTPRMLDIYGCESNIQKFITSIFDFFKLKFKK